MDLFRYLFFFFKQKTAYEMRISDWSSDVCSSDLLADQHLGKLDQRTFAQIVGLGLEAQAEHADLALAERLDEVKRVADLHGVGRHQRLQQRDIDKIGRAHV